MLLRLGLASAWNRRYTLMLTLLSVALAVTLLLGVERLRHATKAAFAQSISGTDLVIGARSSPVQLVLYAVFRLGEATNNLRWSSYESISQLPMVAWSIPLSLGDSHRGFPVLGTTAAYFTHYRHGAAKSLSLIEGRPFATHFEAVLGAEVAARLGYRLGDRIILSHGAGDFSLGEHADKPFVVVGILSPTGTPVDRTASGRSAPGNERRTTCAASANTSAGELAVLPGVALDELWQVVGLVEKILLLVSALVVVIGLAGLVAVVLASLNERRRELAILRSVGASLPQILALLLIEGILLTICGALLGFALLSSLGVVFAPMLESRLGLSLALALPNSQEMKLLGMVVLTGAMSSLIPALQAYRLALADGLNPR